MKFFSRLFAGFGIGLGIALVLGLIIYIWPLFQCTGELICGTVTCDTEMCFGSGRGLCRDCDDCTVETFNQPKYLNTFIFSIIICTLVGGIYGAGLTIKENSENNRRHELEQEKNALDQRLKNASMLKTEIDSTLDTAHSIQKNSKNYTLTPSYISCDKQKKAWECINSTIESNEKLREIIADLDFSGSNKEV